MREDLRYAIRALTHSRGFSSWVVGSLAIGMAVAIAALAVLNAAMFRPFPGVRQQERLVHVTVNRNCGRPDCWIRMSSPSDFLALREGLTGLQSLAAHTPAQLVVAIPEARSMRGTLTSANFFDVLGARAVAGRTFDRTDEDSQAAVAVISYSLWTREFAADPSVVGQPIRVAGEIVHIVGVAPEFFVGIDRVRPGGRGPDMWLPIWMADRVSPLTRAEQRRKERDLNFVGRQGMALNWRRFSQRPRSCPRDSRPREPRAMRVDRPTCGACGRWSRGTGNSDSSCSCRFRSWSSSLPV